MMTPSELKGVMREALVEGTRRCQPAGQPTGAACSCAVSAVVARGFTQPPSRPHPKQMITPTDARPGDAEE
jgi:hypothetical protein